VCKLYLVYSGSVFESEALVVVVAMDTKLPEILGFITGGGFAVFVAVWFLLRLDSRLKEFTEAVHRLELAVERMSPAANSSGRGGMGGRVNQGDS
jgi:hypothetical protein